MKKGIIMEIDDQFLTMLTPDGEFVRTRNLSSTYEIGQEIEFVPIEQENRKQKLLQSMFLNKKGLAAVIACIFMIFSFLFPSYENNKVYAYMSIDINPSIELGMNKKYQVISLHSYNVEGDKIVEKLHNWKRKDVYIVTGEIMNEIKKQGYIRNDDELLIATVFREENKQEQALFLQEKITEIKQAAQSDHLNLIILEATEEERESATEEGLTIGKYKEQQVEKGAQEQKKQGKMKEKEEQHEKVKEKPVSPQNNRDSKTPYGQLKKQENANNQRMQQEQEKNQQKKEQKNQRANNQNNQAKAKKNHHPSEQRNNNKQNGNKGKENKEQNGAQNKHSNKKKEKE